ncbi:hypothetical protein [Comamonas endophytica]|uniref:hypothetical protein n=1 Tax=Comamonas endophytica TaxID=2949090 RepID=UPI003BEF091A
MAPLPGRAEVRLSLGTEVRRYAIAAARLVHSRKITAFDEMRAVMDSKHTTPAPEQQAEARQCLLQATRQHEVAKPRGFQEDALYALEANVRGQ